MATVVPELGVYLKYGQRDITSLIGPFVTQITVTDSLDKLDELKITLEDSRDRWKGDWYPVKTDELILEFGYKGCPKVKIGKFKIASIEITSPPDIIVISANSDEITQDTGTVKTRAYDNKTLRQIVSEIAARLNMQVSGDIADIQFERKTQNKETDKAFLQRLAEEYGYYLAFKLGSLVFTKKEEVKKANSSLEIPRSLCLGYDFIDKTQETYNACTVTYWDAKKKSVISYTENVDKLKNGNTLVISERVENLEQAKARAKAALTAKNERQVSGSLTLVGDVRYVAGTQLNLTGFGVLSGVYTITRASHKLNANGWTITAEIARNELKADDPKDEQKKSTSSSTTMKADKQASGSSKMITVSDDDGSTFQCQEKAANAFAELKALCHKRWPGRAVWISCTTGGQHSSAAHPEGRAIDCGVDGISKAESLELESLARQCGFNTYNEYINGSTYKTGDHMHLYVD